MELDCKHIWHEFYASSWQQMRECYTCGAVARLVPNGPDDNEWVEVDE